MKTSDISGRDIINTMYNINSVEDIRDMIQGLYSEMYSPCNVNSQVSQLLIDDIIPYVLYNTSNESLDAIITLFKECK